MPLLWRNSLWLGLLMGVINGAPALGASESGLFNSAAKAFKDGFYDKAEKDFQTFIFQFTNSARVPEAVLLQAQSRLKQNKTAAAIELLTAGEAGAGKWAEQYVFWIATAYLQQGNLPAAATNFARLAQDFPASPLRLEAVINEANIRGNLGEWPRMVALLKPPGGALESQNNLTNELVGTGYQLLAEAQFATGDYAGAEASLKPLSAVALKPEPAWRRQYLLCRLAVASGKTAEALQSTTNLIALSAQSGSRTLQAQTTTFHAGLLESLRRTDEAVALYLQNVVEGMPPAVQQHALLKASELMLRTGKVADAAQMLERFSTNAPGGTAANLALASLGELRLQQYLEAPPRNPGRSNFLRQAQFALSIVSTNTMDTLLGGKASLNLGWCYWLEERMAEAEGAFARAASACQHLMIRQRLYTSWLIRNSAWGSSPRQRRITWRWLISLKISLHLKRICSSPHYTRL
jgi:TolA-binding protein